jgi:GNAT superfamily N-acetyltransferase
VDTEVNLLGEPKVPDAARLLAGAFAADPVLGYYLPGGWRQRLGFRAFFRAALHESLPHGAVYAARSASDLVGVAAWLPPDPPETPPNRHARRSTATVRTLYPRTGGELFAGFAGLEALHPSEPHWYLMFVGVEPSLQSSGVGAELLSPILERADADRALCYLETPFERTHRFNHRLGFEISSESQPFAAPARIWTMTRSPRAPQVT